MPPEPPTTIPRTPASPIVRYWCARDGGTIEEGRDGFVIIPTDAAAIFLHSPLHRIRDLDDTRCLVLLGEGGMGKTSELRRHYAPGESGRADTHLVDLKQYDQLRDLRAALHDHPAV